MARPPERRSWLPRERSSATVAWSAPPFVRSRRRPASIPRSSCTTSAVRQNCSRRPLDSTSHFRISPMSRRTALPTCSFRCSSACGVRRGLFFRYYGRRDEPRRGRCPTCGVCRPGSPRVGRGRLRPRCGACSPRGLATAWPRGGSLHSVHPCARRDGRRSAHRLAATSARPLPRWPGALANLKMSQPLAAFGLGS